MTTIHAVKSGAKSDPSDYFAMTLVDVKDRRRELVAPISELQEALKESGGVGRLDVQIGSNPAIHHAIVREIREAPTAGEPRHLTVREIRDTDVVRVAVLLEVSIMPDSAMRGWAQVVQRKRHVLVRGPIGAIPERISVDLSEMNLGQSFHVRDLQLPSSVKAVEPESTELFAVRHAPNR